MERRVSGEPVAVRGWQAPTRRVHEGKTVQLEPLDPAAHAEELYAAIHAEEAGQRIWDYLAYGPFADPAALRAWAEGHAASSDPLFFAARDRHSGRASGVASYLNIHPAHGCVEIGHVWFAPVLQNTRQSTEALFLLMQHALDDLGYRRLEWKCNALNEASRRAALRLGFTFEGIFYQHLVVKGRNRDTAWYSILDGEWPAIRANFAAWLADDNFDAQGRQRRSLGDMNRALQSLRGDA